MLDFGKEVNKQLINQEKKVVTSEIILETIERSKKFQFLTESDEYVKTIKQVQKEISEEKIKRKLRKENKQVDEIKYESGKDDQEEEEMNKSESENINRD